MEDGEYSVEHMDSPPKMMSRQQAFEDEEADDDEDDGGADDDDEDNDDEPYHPATSINTNTGLACRQGNTTRRRVNKPK